MDKKVEVEISLKDNLSKQLSSLSDKVKNVAKDMQNSGMMDCLNTKVTVNKEVLKTYAEKEILSVGASLKKEDTFWYETEKATVQDK